MKIVFDHNITAIPCNMIPLHTLTFSRINYRRFQEVLTTDLPNNFMIINDQRKCVLRGRITKFTAYRREAKFDILDDNIRMDYMTDCTVNYVSTHCYPSLSNPVIVQGGP